jgi:hypothetical protein
MGTNKNDTLITVSVELRDKLKKQASKEGRTMKGLLAIIVDDYLKKANK